MTRHRGAANCIIKMTKQKGEIKAIRERHKYLEDIGNIFNIWIIAILVTKMEKPAHSTVTYRKNIFRNLIQESFLKMNKAINMQI